MISVDIRSLPESELSEDDKNIYGISKSSQALVGSVKEIGY